MTEDKLAAWLQGKLPDLSWDGDFTSLAAALRAWLAEHPEEAISPARLQHAITEWTCRRDERMAPRQLTRRVLKALGLYEAVTGDKP